MPGPNAQSNITDYRVFFQPPPERLSTIGAILEKCVFGKPKSCVVRTDTVSSMNRPARGSFEGMRYEAAQRVVVDEDFSGQRIDNYLMGRLKGVPRPHIYRLLRRGEVRVNRARVRQHYRLATGDLVRIPPLRFNPESEPARSPTPSDKRMIERAILHEDERLIVLDKPSGIAVHGGSGIDFGVIESLRALRPDLRRLELVHRLDRDTSGCLVIAVDRTTLKELHKAIRQGSVRKEYLLLVKGDCGSKPLVCDAPLKREERHHLDRIVRVDSTGKPSRTRFEPLARGEIASLVRARPLTGRTHQIRVHAASLGLFLAGDRKYGDRAFNRRMRDLGLHRLFLHASSITLPMSKGSDGSGDLRMRFHAPLGEDLKSSLTASGLRHPHAENDADRHA